VANVDLDKLRIARAPIQPETRPRSMLARNWRWLAGLAVLGAVAAYLIHPPAVDVQTTQVVLTRPSQQYVVLNATGYVVARRKAAVASKGTGQVVWLGVSEGSYVKAGELIARLESRDVEAAWQNAVANSAVAVASLQAARVDMLNAEQQYERSKNLQKQNFISPAALDDSRARYERAKASVNSALASVKAARASENGARNAVDYTLITAPFDGVVIARSANVGDVITPLSSAADAKGAVAVLADMSTLEIDADVSESALSSIRTGQPCEIVFDAYPQQVYRGQVSTIVPTVNRASATVTTKVRILDADSRILPDMSAKVRFLSRELTAAENHPVLAADPAAITRRGEREVVYRVSKTGRVEEISVRPGARLGDLRVLAALPASQPGADLQLKHSPWLVQAGLSAASPATTPPLALSLALDLLVPTVQAADPRALKAGDLLVLKPGDRLADGTRVALKAP
jgi:RND family efflux transporter MFP subunit